jgi:NAD(P)-dependent dehydrogenase (short-subunit alcohol dehydrogenase family)
MSLRKRSLSSSVVFITGGARGIGAELARMAVRRGAKVALADLALDPLRSLADELGASAAWFECDVTDSASLDAAVRGTVERFGGIDVVVANAGVGTYVTVALADPELQAKTVEVNLTGVMRTVSATLPQVTGRHGYLLLVSSASAFAAMPGMSAYCASKAGVEQFGNVLRQELAAKNVAVGVAHPCWIDTDMVREIKAEIPTWNEIHKQMPGPLGSWTSVQDCAEALIGGIERRRRRIYVPRSLAGMQALRAVVLSPVGDLRVRRMAKLHMAQLEQEMQAHAAKQASGGTG